MFSYASTRTRVHVHARTHTDTNTHRHRHTDTQTQTQTHTHTHTHTHTYTHTHTHTRARTRTHISQITQRMFRELKSIGVGDREKVSFQLRFEGRQSFSMSHRERDIVPDGRTNVRKCALFLELFTSVRSTEDESVSRGPESV